MKLNLQVLHRSEKEWIMPSREVDEKRMTMESAIYSKLTEIFSDVFMRDDIELTPGLTAKDVEGWDSFKQIEIIMSVEDRFNIKATTRELDSLASVGDLVSLIATKTTQS
jgi:acyl carrier protein